MTSHFLFCPCSSATIVIGVLSSSVYAITLSNRTFCSIIILNIRRNRHFNRFFSVSLAPSDNSLLQILSSLSLDTSLFLILGFHRLPKLQYTGSFVTTQYSLLQSQYHFVTDSQVHNFQLFHLKLPHNEHQIIFIRVPRLLFIISSGRLRPIIKSTNPLPAIANIAVTLFSFLSYLQ